MKPLIKNLKAEMHLFFENDRSRELYIIQTGKVQVYKKVGNREIELAVLGKGAVLGEMALIDGKSRSASAKALEPTRVIIVDAESFYEKTKGVPPWYMSIVKMTSQKIRNANNRLHNTSGINQSISAILALYYLFGSTGNGVFDIGKIKQQLIQLLGITHQRAASIFSHLHKFKYLDIKNDRIQLVDEDGLTEYCQFLRLMIHKQIVKYLNCPAEMQQRCAEVVKKHEELKQTKQIDITERDFCDIFIRSESGKQQISPFIDTLCDYEMLFCKRDPANRYPGSADVFVKLQNPGWNYMFLIYKHFSKYSEL